MLNVGLLTSHSSMNYGGLLQAYALQEKFGELGCKCTIINYKPQMHDIKKHPISFIMQRKNVISRSIFTIKNYSAFKKRMQIINEFKDQYFHSSPVMTISKDEIKEEADKYDIVCCGSDQLWNLSQNDNANKAYMLDYDRNNYTISYAVSFGDALKIKKQELSDSTELVRKFDAVSVRDDASAEFLREHGVDAAGTLDPILLIDEKFWERFQGKKVINHPYILIYGFENANQKYEDLIKVAERFSYELRLPVVNVLMNPKIAKRNFENIYDCGPVEFLSLIQNATLICTNSFHASIFSIIYNRPFVSVFGCKGEKDIRKASLLSMLGLEKRAITLESHWNIEEIMNVNYSDAFDRLHTCRKNSDAFLEKTINEVRSRKAQQQQQVNI